MSEPAIDILALVDIHQLDISLEGAWLYALIVSQHKDGQIFNGQAPPFRRGELRTKTDKRPWCIGLPDLEAVQDMTRWDLLTCVRTLVEVSRFAR